jgi:hypothetical protein
MDYTIYSSGKVDVHCELYKPNNFKLCATKCENSHIGIIFVCHKGKIRMDWTDYIFYNKYFRKDWIIK